jgi:putative FmdB family regulatory protein
MPLREYLCKDCGHVFENYERSTADAATQCVQCDSCLIERLVSAFGGYNGDLGSASTKPRGAGSFKRHK